MAQVKDIFAKQNLPLFVNYEHFMIVLVGKKKVKLILRDNYKVKLLSCFNQKLQAVGKKRFAE